MADNFVAFFTLLSSDEIERELIADAAEDRLDEFLLQVVFNHVHGKVEWGEHRQKHVFHGLVIGD